MMRFKHNYDLGEFYILIKDNFDGTGQFIIDRSNDIERQERILIDYPKQLKFTELTEVE